MSGIRLRSVALPSEHGGWGLVLEPLVLGLLLFPSVSGLGLAVAVVAAFLIHQPLQVAWRDRRRGKRYPRTRAAEACAAIYTVLALAGAAFVLFRTGPGPFLPLATALPLAVAFVVATFAGKARTVGAEATGAGALAAGASGVAWAGGSPAELAWALWGLAAVRSVPAVLYVRARLRLERSGPGEKVSRGPALSGHVLGVAVVGGLSVVTEMPVMTIPAAVLLLLRAAWGLSPWRRGASARQVGIAELGWGAAYVLLLAAGG